MSAALPDRYGGKSKDDTSGHVVTNNFLISIGIIVGACGVAVMASSIVVKTGEFYGFANYALEMLRQTQFVVYVGYGSLILGFLGILCGFFVALSGLLVSQYPRAIYCALFCLLLSAAGNIAAGAVVQQGVQLLNSAIYQQSATPAAIGSFAQNVTHFQISMFNACCASQGFAYTKELFTSDVRSETKDPDGRVKFCGSLHPANIANMENGNLRQCFIDQETYRQFNFSVGLNSARICATLTEARVNIAGKKVPGTNFDVSGFTGGNNIIPIVGVNGAPDYGCGVGYSKAFQAQMLIWAENIIQPVGTAFIACGAVYLVLLLLSVATFYGCSKQGQETAEERYARYLEEINNSSSGNRPAQVQDNFEQANPNNRMSVNQPMTAIQYSQRLSVQSHATHGSHTSQYGQQPAASYMQQQDVNFNVDDKI